jgi:hypothetical protein
MTLFQGDIAARKMALHEFYYHADKIISVSGALVDGWVVKLLSSGDNVLADETVVAGVVVIDVLEVWMADVASVAVFDSFDVEIVRNTPIDGVWGGDTYVFSVI